MIRTYLEWLAQLPWAVSSEDNLDLKRAPHARRDHYDIDRVKDRILEFIAVRKLKPDARSSILCFVGPPGVGKTSLGRSIAAAMGRAFERISVGGVRDESEIRGHRRTYVGAMPGTILRAMRDAGRNNPVFMIDEIDKMGSDSAAIPRARCSRCSIPSRTPTSATTTSTSPSTSRACSSSARPTSSTPCRPLRDRMEVIELSGYTHEEKREIALALSCRARWSATASVARGSSSPTPRSISSSTATRARRACAIWSARSARSAARWRGSSPRARASRSAQSVRRRSKSCSASGAFSRTPRAAPTSPGWPPGSRGPGEWAADVLFVESTAFPGEGNLQITGQLGDVMKESAAAALSYVKARASALDGDLPDDWFRSHDVHVHVPAGAVPKDGPSAGITMAAAIASRITGRPVLAPTRR